MAALTSLWLINASPIRKVVTPAASIDARSAGLDSPLSPTVSLSPGTWGASRRVVSMSVLEGLEVAVVDPDQPVVDRQRAPELFLVVDLDKHVHPEFPREGGELPGPVVFESGHDQQDAIGPDRPRLGHLIGIESEILAQNRQTDGSARRGQVLVRPPEIG